jgi:trans-aconitate methyltransferase
MEGLEQARAYGAADFSATDQALVERLAELLGPAGQLEPLRIVDLGCGPGNISFRLVERFARAQVLGLDGAAAMLDLAAEGLDRHPDWRPRLSFRSALLPLGPGLAQELAGGAGAGFGVVVSNSLLHHLHGPQVLWRTVRQLGAPGAFVLIRDLRRPATPEAVRQLVQRQTGSSYQSHLHQGQGPGAQQTHQGNPKDQHGCEVLAQPVVANLRGEAAIDDDIRELGGKGALERVTGQSVPQRL